jgi:thiamine-phosphate pyrophosphorylase
MIRKVEGFGLYVIITRPTLSYTTIAEQCVKMGIRMLQLREKHLDDKQLLRVARELRQVTKGTNSKLVINDRPDIAALCDADYLHLGQDDIPIEEARKIVGDMKIGLSTHSIAQAKQALTKNPDYIGFGPIYPTNAKAKPDPPVGTEQLKQVVEFSNVPVVAIGGIFPENIEEVLSAGATSIAMVRHLMQTEFFTECAKMIIERIENYEYSTSICS